MTDASDEEIAFPPAAFAEQLQRASEEFTTQQRKWFDRMLSGGTPTNGSLGDLGTMSMHAAVFKTRVQSGGRISIPDAEREALDIGEGDLVQAFVVPLDRGDSDE
ncbi:MAG: AbrB/MazE/SpoVT family DNA-binding domain-containing protein [Haloferacaceae archaeon]